MGANLAPRIVA